MVFYEETGAVIQIQKLENNFRQKSTSLFSKTKFIQLERVEKVASIMREYQLIPHDGTNGLLG